MCYITYLSLKKFIRHNLSKYKIIFTLRNDWLEIRDGGNENAPIIGKKLCGNDIPDMVISRGNELFVEFHSSHAGTDMGYKIFVHNETKLSKLAYIKQLIYR